MRNLDGSYRASRIDLALVIEKYLNMDESLCNSIEWFTPDFKGGGSVASPPDISTRMENLKKFTGVETMGVNDAVKNGFWVNERFTKKDTNKEFRLWTNYRTWVFKKLNFILCWKLHYQDFHVSMECFTVSSC